jgi:outer membrane protein TolC
MTGIWPTAAGLAALLLAAAAPGFARAQSADPAVQDLIRRYPLEEVEGRKVARLSLRDVLQIAIERSLSIFSARLGESAAQHSLTAAKDRNNPSLVTSLQQGRNISPTSTINPNTYRTLVGSDFETLQATLSKKDSLGITYGLTYQEARSRTDLVTVTKQGDPAQSTLLQDWRDTSTLTTTVTVPLGKDGGWTYNEIPIRQAETGVSRSESSRRKAELDLLSQIAQTYWQLVGALETVRVRQEAVKLSAQLLADNRIRLQAGVLSPADVQVSETQAARDRQALLDAKLQVLAIEDQVRAALNLEGLEIGLIPQDTPTLRTEPLDLPTHLEQLYKNSPDLQITRADLALSDYTLQQERNNDRTKLDFNVFLTLNGQANKEFEGTKQFSDQGTQSYGAGFTYTLPLFDYATSANIQRRTLERQQVELRLADQRSLLSVQLQTALRNLKLAEEQVNTAREALRLAEVQHRNEMERFRLGRSTAFQVSQFQQQLLEARLAEIQARVGFERNDVQRLVLTNRLLEHYNLTPPPGQKP